MSRARVVNKDKIARSFLRGKATYDSHARIQQRVSKNLLEMVSAHETIGYSRVLEIGCCTGTLTELLLRTFKIEKLYLNDLVADFYDDVKDRLAGIGTCTIEAMFGDIERLDLPQDLDLVISSSTFQWLADLSKLFHRIHESLKPSGHLVFSIFGPGTLTEFREITGIGLDYSTIGTVLDMLEDNYVIEEELTVKDQLFFATPREVLRHLQATGVGGVQEHRWTPGRLREFEQRYGERFGGASGVPVTYISSYIVASRKA